MIGVGALVDFEMFVTRPRREYVMLPCRTSIPESLEEWKEECLASAVALARERLQERYESSRQFVDLRVKHGLLRISQFLIELSGEGNWHIRRWSSPEGNYLFFLMLEERFLMKGDVPGYYERLDHIPEPSLTVRSIYSDEIQGVTDPKDVAAEMMFKLPTYRDPTRGALEQMDKERLKTPIIHTR